MIKPPAYLTEDHAAAMTLRDYFAAKTMQGIWSNATTLAQMPKGAEAESIASVAYEMADAMLKERSDD